MHACASHFTLGSVVWVERITETESDPSQLYTAAELAKLDIKYNTIAEFGIVVKVESDHMTIARTERKVGGYSNIIRIRIPYAAIVACGRYAAVSEHAVANGLVK